MAKKRTKIQSILFVALFVGLLFGGFAFWIKSDEVESVAWSNILLWAGIGCLATFGLYWAIAFARDKRESGK